MSAPQRSKSRRGERRRKAGIHGRGRQKLSVPNLPGYFCYWANDVGNRLHDLTRDDDYDYVSKSEIGDHVGESGDGNTDLGTKVRVLVGTDDKGPIYAYLLKKRLDFYNDDQAEKEANRRKKEESLHQGSDQIENQYGSIT